MSIERTAGGKWKVRYRTGGRGSTRLAKTFDRKRDAELFEADIRRRKALGELALLDGRRQTLDDLARDWYELYAAPNLAANTLNKYRRMLANHVLPKLGGMKASEITPDVLARFRAELEREGVGRDSVRVSLVVVQAIFRRAIEWGRLSTNPAMAVRKPSGRRERVVHTLAPAQVEAIRRQLPLGDATLVSVIAYAGLRCPEEVLALEWRHVGERTLLVEQRNIDGEIVPGQKVRGAPPRSVELVSPLQQDLAEWRLRCGRPGHDELVFPRFDKKPWHRHNWNNWRPRVWKPALERAGVPYVPPYDLRHAFASLQIRAGVSVPELAEQLGHSPQMTLSTYTHVIRELRGTQPVPMEEQIRRARESGGPPVDPLAIPSDPQRPGFRSTPDSSGWTRTTDLTIMSGAL